MSARVIAVDLTQKYDLNVKNSENQDSNKGREFLRDITPKKINVLTNTYRRQYITREDDHFQLRTNQKVPLFNNFATSQITPKKSEVDRQRQMAKIREVYQEQIKILQRKYQKDIFELQEQCKREEKQKNYWKETTMKMKQQLELKVASNVGTSSPKFTFNIPVEEKGDSEKIRKLEEDIKRIGRANNDLYRQVEKMRQKNRSCETKLRAAENSLKTAQDFIKNIQKKETDSGLRIDENRSKSPIRVSGYHNSAISRSSHHRESSNRSHRSHMKNSHINLGNNGGDLQKKLDQARKMNQNMEKTIEQSNQDLIKEKMRVLNSKYANFI